MAVQETDAVGGVIITASHNPQQWNALKFLEGQGLFLNAEQNAAVKARYDAEDGHVAWDQVGTVTSETDADERTVAVDRHIPSPVELVSKRHRQQPPRRRDRLSAV